MSLRDVFFGVAAGTLITAAVGVGFYSFYLKTVSKIGRTEANGLLLLGQCAVAEVSDEPEHSQQVVREIKSEMPAVYISDATVSTVAGTSPLLGKTLQECVQRLSSKDPATKR